MSIADEAFNEAKRRVELVPMGDEADVQFAAGFIEGAEWQASRKVEVTDEMVNAAAFALMRDDPEAQSGTYGLDDYRAMARAALESAFRSDFGG